MRRAKGKAELEDFFQEIDDMVHCDMVVWFLHLDFNQRRGTKEKKVTNC